MFSRTFMALFLLTGACLTLHAQSKDTGQTNVVAKAPQYPPLKVTSTSFQDGAEMPIPYTCHGVNISPAISWEGAPANTESFVLICEDPGATYKSFAHWIVFNIPKDAKGLPEKLPVLRQLTNGTQQGFNDFKTLGYKGPCPPTGVHRYHFKVYALNTTLLLLGDVTKDKVLDAMKGRIVAEGQIVAKYGH